MGNSKQFALSEVINFHTVITITFFAVMPKKEWRCVYFIYVAFLKVVQRSAFVNVRRQREVTAL